MTFIVKPIKLHETYAVVSVPNYSSEFGEWVTTNYHKVTHVIRRPHPTYDAQKAD